MTRCCRLPANIADDAGHRYRHREPGPRRNRRLQHGPGEQRVISGATASTISVLAVDVSVSASMKQMNIVAHMQPDMIPADAGAPQRAGEVTSNQQQIAADEDRGEQAAPERDLEPTLRLQLR